MIHKIAVAGCLHKRPKDISTIKGYVEANMMVQKELLKFITSNNITHFISSGDWYDRGYIDDVASAIADVSYEEYLRLLLNGNFYGVIGNHIHLQLDSNPESIIIQPHATLKSRKKVTRDYQIMKTPNNIVIDNVQISLVHYQPNSESPLDYMIRSVSSNIRYHIAITHDDVFIPPERLNSLGIPTRHSNMEITKTFYDVDFVVAGHIHAPMGLHQISSKTKMLIPGSLSNTNAGLKSRHNSIIIPVFEIDDDKHTIGVEFKDFNLHTNLLTFYDVKEESKKKLKSLRGKNVDSLYEDKNIVSMTGDLGDLTFKSFLSSQGYKSSDRELIKSVLRNPEDIGSLVSIYRKGQLEI